MEITFASQDVLGKLWAKFYPLLGAYSLEKHFIVVVVGFGVGALITMVLATMRGKDHATLLAIRRDSLIGLAWVVTLIGAPFAMYYFVRGLRRAIR